MHSRLTALSALHPPLQVNQAMKLGVPVVATKIATEGMHTIDGVNCLVANNPREFAEKVRDAYIDCGMWSKLSRGGYDNIKEWFSVDHARLEILRAFYMVGAGPKAEHSRQKCQ
jgi:glycosyltransferase involved in cell wall biosynthesis